MKELKTYPSTRGKCYNLLTVKLSLKLKDNIDNDRFEVYVYKEKMDNSYYLRVPGMTIGCIYVDNDNIITGIRINKDCQNLFKEEYDSLLEKIIGLRLIKVDE